jgi:hypothetical protein
MSDLSVVVRAEFSALGKPSTRSASEALGAGAGTFLSTWSILALADIDP